MKVNGSTVLFRCDATADAGMGHLVRCLALAEALAAADGASVHLAGDFHLPFAQEMLADTNIHVHAVPASAEHLIVLAGRIGASIVHVDHYAELGGLAEAGRAAGIVTSTATDSEFGRRPADVIVDGSPAALVRFDPLYSHSDVCLGPFFLPLRRGLAQTRRIRQVPERDLDVLVLMGGTDSCNLGPAVADAIHGLPGIRRVGLVGSPPGSAILQVKRKKDIVTLFRDWDLVVTAAGTTVWELAAMRIPMAVVGVAENQRDQYDTLVQDGLATGLGFVASEGAVDHGALSVDALAEVLLNREILQHRVTAAGALVDGDGACRVVRTWLQVLRRQGSDRWRVRDVWLSDAGRLFAWRSDPDTRAASRATGEVSWADHISWLNSSVSRSDRFLFIIEAEGEPVGTARFDAGRDGAWEVSVTVAPDSRGRGLGGKIVAEASNRLVVTLEAAGREVRQLVAVLRVDNNRSRSIFRRLGYRKESLADGWEHWILEI